MYTCVYIFGFLKISVCVTIPADRFDLMTAMAGTLTVSGKLTIRKFWEERAAEKFTTTNLNKIRKLLPPLKVRWAKH